MRRIFCRLAGAAASCTSSITHGESVCRSRIEVKANAVAHAAGRRAAIAERAAIVPVAWPGCTKTGASTARLACSDAHDVAIDEPESARVGSATWSALPQTCLLNGLGHSCSQALLATLPSNTEGSGASVRTRPVPALRGRDLRQLGCRQRLFRGGGVGDHAIVQRLPPPVFEIARRAELRAPLRAHEIVGGCAHGAAQKGEEIMRACAYRRAAGSAAEQCLRCRHGAHVGPAFQRMG